MRMSIKYAVLPIAALIALSGCSDDADDESSQTPDATTTADTGTTDDETTDDETTDSETTDEATDSETTDDATDSETTDSGGTDTGTTDSAAPGADDPARQEACLEAAELSMTFGSDAESLTDPDVVREYAQEFGELAERTQDEVIQPLLAQYEGTLDEFATALEEQDFATIQSTGGDLLELATEYGEACAP